MPLHIIFGIPLSALKCVTLLHPAWIDDDKSHGKRWYDKWCKCLKQTCPKYYKQARLDREKVILENSSDHSEINHVVRSSGKKCIVCSQSGQLLIDKTSKPKNIENKINYSSCFTQYMFKSDYSVGIDSWSHDLNLIYSNDIIPR